MSHFFLELMQSALLLPIFSVHFLFFQNFTSRRGGQMETGESEQVKGTLKDSMYSCVLPCDSGTKQY